MKTNDHNKQLYRDMQEAPDKYSDQEIEAMMDDLDQMPDASDTIYPRCASCIRGVRWLP